LGSTASLAISSWYVFLSFMSISGICQIELILVHIKHLLCQTPTMKKTHNDH
jgi:hypothetical protein